MPRQLGLGGTQLPRHMGPPGPKMGGTHMPVTPAYDMPTVCYEIIRPRYIYKSIVHVPAVSKKE